MHKKNAHNKGIVEFVVIALVAIAILAYFGVRATDVAGWGPFQTLMGWMGWFWHTIVIGFIWKGFVFFFGLGGSGAHTTATTTQSI